MQSRSVNQGEASFYNVANSTVCTEQWWKGTGYNSFSHALMRRNASNSSSLEQSLDGQSQSEGVMNEEDEDTVKQPKGDDAVKTSGSDVPLQPGSDRIDHLEGTSLLQDGPTLQPRPCENLTQPAQLELLSHSTAFAPSKYDPYYGGMVVAAAYGQPVVPHLYDMHHVRMPLPLEVAQEPVYVNAKQYHGILRRRQSRAKATLEKKLITSRKPYLHESRHQHAMRRARSSGGRFAKKSDPEATSKRTGSSSSLSSQSTNSSQPLFPNSTSPEMQNLYNPAVDSYRKQGNSQVESVYRTHAGQNREGFSSSQQWGNITSNRALAMQ